MGFTEKSDFQGVHEKPIYRGDCLKEGVLGKFSDLRGGGLGNKEEGGVFKVS